MVFRKDINGLRAIAVLVVVLFHFKVIGFDGGFSGVDIFFVISGYLMTGIIFTRIQSHNFLVIDFYLHRARRIIPALAFLCICLTLFSFFFLLTGDLREVTQNIRKVILFVSNYEFYKETGYFDTPAQENWLLHTWSLSVEWQFYLIYPLIVMGLSKLFTLNKIRFILIIFFIVSLSFSIIYTPFNPSFAFYSLPTRTWEMLAGGIVYLFPLSLSIYSKRLVEWLGLGLILASVLFLNDSFLWPGYLALIPVVGTMLIIWSNRDSLTTSNFIFQWIGKISYSVYLWHWPVAVLLLTNGLLLNPIYKMIGIIVSFILGTLSYLLIEKKFKLTHNRKIEAIKYIVIILITILLAAVSGSLAKHHPELRNQSLVKLNDIFENKFKILSKRCLLNSFEKNSSVNCIVGDGEPNIIVWGDSHSTTLFPVINSLNEKGATLYWSLNSCPSIVGVKKTDIQGCADFVSTRLEILKKSYSNTPILIVNRLTPYFYDNSKIYFDKESTDFKRDFRHSYISTMCQVAKNRPVYVVKPIPQYPYDIVKRVATDRFFFFNKETMTISMSAYQADNQFILDIMNEASKKCGIHLLTPTNYLCKNGICHAKIGDRILYFDDNHLSDEGAKELTPMIEGIFNKK